ncbi:BRASSINOSTEROID INSENSITIVE 1-associated receptor kinase 1-like [Syzygium oleosum]|uniref:BRASSINOSTEROID INSENSITIVE 1-associated receptor kinase 1-like n=1 Tax=Syzygium oleosum TaxID=219896 RepID=UPI0024BA6B67|nr:BRASSINOSTEROID INSENSITIVE 1-associated receptor kinase 1-like [Syzygium oleosum]KAI6673728.1 hypothetical protein NL676_001634 [Syzygium grande]
MVFNLRSFSSTESVEGDPTRPKSFSLKELRVATDNFSSNNFIRYDLYGKVYRGRLANGSLVAVKRSSFDNRQSEQDFEAEVQVGSTVSTHPNVLCLMGFCRTKKELLLVYPFMINKTLSYNLRERPDRFARPLDWTTRKQIALGAARGLAHLHNQGNIKIMHRNIRASSILLNVHFEAVIGGFSLAFIKHEKNVEEDVYIQGTTGFTAPEYINTGKCTPKNDVFAYGKMLLELISGQLIYLDDGNGNFFCLENWTRKHMNEDQLGRVIDPNLQGNYVEEEAERLVRLALLCAQRDASVRPEMSEVVRMLETQFLQRDPSTSSSLSQSECDSAPNYSCPPSPSPLGIAP